MAAALSSPLAARPSASSAGENSFAADFSPEILSDFLGDGGELALYRGMLLIRRFEEKAGLLFGMGLIGGFCHLYIGQEAVVVGMRLAASPRDQFITSYRQHGHLLACGADPKAVMAEMTGRSGGLSGGKGGSMHMYAPEGGFYGGHGIVAGQVSIGTGLAFANAYRGDGRVCVAFFGDGAADQGQVAESLVMAARWRLPIVFVIENNRALPEDEGSGAPLADRGAAFGIPGAQVDGMCVQSVREAGEGAIFRAREGGGPTILEMRTERFRGHSMADPGKYRRKGEERRGPSSDPLDRQREKILALGLAGEADLKSIDAEVRARVGEAAEYAAQCPEPDPGALETNVLL
ncbi:thiamine pyrophosphate-dependent enzyme [uncultured Rhodoblastus sp.]|uniref:thiamine pyrophosphate-dependent enzyme n=1 Tax=uncultured Rhodoblastus sp. TaxID=543037 RepID=UPI0025F5DEA8|nr:thiamine pyrophosphate-dependent enzyme [uncultured Rhodoblastus sp.]